MGAILPVESAATGVMGILIRSLSIVRLRALCWAADPSASGGAPVGSENEIGELADRRRRVPSRCDRPPHHDPGFRRAIFPKRRFR